MPKRVPTGVGADGARLHGGGEGWAGSVGVPSQASVTVPPIGRITLPGAGLSGREVTIGVKLAGVGEARGQWAELGEPVPVLVHSNVPWRVRVWVSDPQWAGAVAVRVGGGPYRVVGDGGTVLTCGGLVPMRWWSISGLTFPCSMAILAGWFPLCAGSRASGGWSGEAGHLGRGTAAESPLVRAV